jgi:hypothetical protein
MKIAQQQLALLNAAIEASGPVNSDATLPQNECHPTALATRVGVLPKR